MSLSGQRRIVFLAVGLVVASGAYWGYSVFAENRDTSKVHAMTQKMKTICVGRFLLDLPADAEVKFRAARIAGVVFSGAAGASPETVRDEIKDLQDLLAGKDNEMGEPTLERQVDVDARNFKATVLYYNRAKPLVWFEKGGAVSSGDQGITVEAFGLKDDVRYHFKGDDLSAPKFEKNVEMLLARFEARDDDTIPAYPGFCAGRAFVHDPISTDENEQVTVFIGLKEHPDVAIRLDTAVVDTPTGSLLERDAANPALIDHPDRFTTLRKGARALNTIAGEEVLYRSKEFGGATNHGFMWSSNNKVGDVMVPAVTLEIVTGKVKGDKRVDSSLSDEALLQLWNKISGSLRIRPTTLGVEGKPPSADHTAPLGEMSGTGTSCPQTGFWACSEGGIILGQRRQFFRAGEILPQATLVGKANLWQKLRGDVPSHQINTVWTLVEYEAETPATVSRSPLQGEVGGQAATDSSGSALSGEEADVRRDEPNAV